MAKKVLCCTLTAPKVHQVLLAIFGLINLIGAAWLIGVEDYPFHNGDTIRSSVSLIVLHLYHIMLSLCLFSAAALGSTRPMEWFGLLTNFIGSGFYLVFIGFLTLRLATVYGMVVGIVTIVYGIGSIIYGFATKKEMLENGTSYRNLMIA
ncbi:hypothetical protein THRCLA_20426 [Thraustotheca clavata]|uniref:Uncharacterized protein n=1 Tax=Thraustotheca clavata TaxID=74557 RepID=A0A1W0A7J3_9STRA|nr:hypothetical protein THRCLA_20426 [Thraustotheca clavata]